MKYRLILSFSFIGVPYNTFPTPSIPAEVGVGKTFCVAAKELL